MERLAIIGSGELAKQITHFVNDEQQYKVIGCFDDFQKEGAVIHGNRILGKTDVIQEQYRAGQFDCLIIGIGYNHMASRKSFYQQFSGEIPFATIIHESAFVDKSAQISDGVIIYPNCTIDQGVHIKENVLLNLNCTIAHDSIIGAHSFIAPSVNIAGFVKVGECANLGINTTIIDNMEISEFTKTGASTVIVKPISEAGIYVGCPARKIK